jgi:hypothetical protein
MVLPGISWLLGAAGFVGGDKLKDILSLSKQGDSILASSAKSHEVWINAINIGIKDLYTNTHEYITYADKDMEGGKISDDVKPLLGPGSLVSAVLDKVNLWNEVYLPQLLSANPVFDPNDFQKGGVYRNLLEGGKFNIPAFEMPNGKKVNIDITDLKQLVPNDIENNFFQQYFALKGNVQLAGTILDEFQNFSQSMTLYIKAFGKLFDEAGKLNKLAVTADLYDFTSQTETDKAKFFNIKSEGSPAALKGIGRIRNTFDFLRKDKTKRAMATLLATETIVTMQQIYGVNSLHEPGAEQSVLNSLYFSSTKVKAELMREVFENFSHYVLDYYDDPEARLPIQDKSSLSSRFLNVKEALEQEYGITDKKFITKKHLIDLSCIVARNVLQESNLSRNQGGIMSYFEERLSFLIKEARIDISPRINSLQDEPYAFKNNPELEGNDKYFELKFSNKKYYLGTQHGVMAATQIANALKTGIKVGGKVEKGPNVTSLTTALAPVISINSDPQMFKRMGIPYDQEANFEIKPGNKKYPTKYINDNLRHPDLKNPHSHAPSASKSLSESAFGFTRNEVTPEVVGKFLDIVESRSTNKSKIQNTPKNIAGSAIKGLGGSNIGTGIKWLAGATVITVGLGVGYSLYSDNQKEKRIEEFRETRDKVIDQNSGTEKSTAPNESESKKYIRNSEQSYPNVESNPFNEGTIEYKQWKIDSLHYQDKKPTSMNVPANTKIEMISQTTEAVSQNNIQI